MPSFSKAITFKIHDSNSVQFVYRVALIKLKGQFSIDKSYFKIDFEKPSSSEFQLYLDVKSSSAGFPLATQLMLIKSILSSEEHPKISFTSKRIARSEKGFKIWGTLTIKGIKKEIELLAKIDMEDTDNFENSSYLTFAIFAKIFRGDYGADGYSGLVSDKIVLDSKITVSREN